MKQLTIILFLNILSISLWSQSPCYSFDCAIERAQKLIASKNYRQVFNDLHSADGYAENQEDKEIINKFRKQLFDAIENDRIIAVRNELKAKEEKERADSLAQEATEALKLAEARRDSLILEKQETKLAEEKTKAAETSLSQLKEFNLLLALVETLKKNKNYESATQYLKEAEKKLQFLKDDEETVNITRKEIQKELIECEKKAKSYQIFLRHMEIGDSLAKTDWDKYSLAYDNYFSALKSGLNDIKAKDGLIKLNNKIGSKLKKSNNLKGKEYFKLVAKNAHSNYQFGDIIKGNANLYRALRHQPKGNVLKDMINQFPSLEDEIESFIDQQEYQMIVFSDLRFHQRTNDFQTLSILDGNGNEILNTVSSLAKLEIGLGYQVISRYLINFFLGSSRIEIYSKEEDNYLGGTNVYEIGFHNKYSMKKLTYKQNRFNFRAIGGISLRKISLLEPINFEIIDANRPPNSLINQVNVGNSVKLNTSEILFSSNDGNLSCENFSLKRDINYSPFVLHFGADLNIKPSISKRWRFNLGFLYKFSPLRPSNGKYFNIGNEIASEIKNNNKDIEPQTLDEVYNYYHTNCNIQVRNGATFREYINGLSMNFGVEFGFYK